MLLILFLFHNIVLLEKLKIIRYISNNSFINNIIVFIEEKFVKKISKLFTKSIKKFVNYNFIYLVANLFLKKKLAKLFYSKKNAKLEFAFYIIK